MERPTPDQQFPQFLIDFHETFDVVLACCTVCLFFKTAAWFWHFLQTWCYMISAANQCSPTEQYMMMVSMNWRDLPDMMLDLDGKVQHGQTLAPHLSSTVFETGRSCSIGPGMWHKYKSERQAWTGLLKSWNIKFVGNVKIMLPSWKTRKLCIRREQRRRIHGNPLRIAEASCTSPFFTHEAGSTVPWYQLKSWCPSLVANPLIPRTQSFEIPHAVDPRPSSNKLPWRDWSDF